MSAANTNVTNVKVIRPKPKKGATVWVQETVAWLKAKLWKLGTARDGDQKDWAKAFAIPGQNPDDHYWYPPGQYTFDDPKHTASPKSKDWQPTRQASQKLNQSKQVKARMRAVAVKAVEHEALSKAARKALQKNQDKKAVQVEETLSRLTDGADAQLEKLLNASHQEDVDACVSGQEDAYVEETKEEEPYVEEQEEAFLEERHEEEVYVSDQEDAYVSDSGYSPQEEEYDCRPRVDRSPRPLTPTIRGADIADLYPVGSACLYFSPQLHAGSPPCDEIVSNQDGTTALLAAWHLVIVHSKHIVSEVDVTSGDWVDRVAIILWTGRVITAHPVDLVPLENCYDADLHKLTFGRYAHFPDLCRRYGKESKYVPVEFSKLPVLHAKYKITPAEADNW